MKKMLLVDITLGGILLIGVLVSSLTASNNGLPCSSTCETKCKVNKTEVPMSEENGPFRFDGFYYKL